MGAWDYGIFDDDSAYDFFDEIERNPVEFFKNSIMKVKHSDYVEYEDGQAILVSAAYIDNHINKSVYRNDNEDEKSIANVNMFYLLEPNLDFSNLIDDLKIGLKKLISNDSELNELWEENEELYPKWRGQIENIIGRL